MKHRDFLRGRLWRYLLALVLVVVILSCQNERLPLAPYAGSPVLSGIVVEEGSFTPRMTWLGGYVSALGVNRGPTARLDSTLVWLIHSPGDNIHYPVRFGLVPPASNELTSRYGGVRIDSLVEDETYTFWVLKGEVWEQVSAMPGKTLKVDYGLAKGEIAIGGDTLRVSGFSHAQKTQALDVFVNVRDVRTFGRLANVNVVQSSRSNNPLVTWVVKQSGVTDSCVAAIGLNLGGAYDPKTTVWEVWSADSSGGRMVYGKKNVIPSPVVLGQRFAETKVFVEYPAEGLQRGKDYYLWIAQKDWDGVGRTRTANFYAFAVFRTW